MIFFGEENNKTRQKNGEILKIPLDCVGESRFGERNKKIVSFHFHFNFFVVFSFFASRSLLTENCEIFSKEKFLCEKSDFLENLVLKIKD